ncbi:MAG: MOSC domain-containing protein [Pseudomonadales bacterium]
MISVSELIIYPIKSCAGISVGEFMLDRFGPKDDRRWMIIDNEGQQVTQREVAELALIKPRLTNSGLHIEFKEEHMSVDQPVGGAAMVVQIWADSVQAIDAGDKVAQWLSEQLATSLRLVWMPDNSQREVEKPIAKLGETVSFADAFPLLLISQASLDDLNSRLDVAVPMNRFRPNIVVTGCDAFAEDSWRRIQVNQLELQVAKACARCVMPSIDQQTAAKDSAILRALASFRRGDDKQTYFGQNLLYQSFSMLKTGSQLKILE